METLNTLIHEHLLLRGQLDYLEAFTLLDEENKIEKLSRILLNIKSIWDPHEEKEEKFFTKLSKSGIGIEILNEKMLIEEHRQLRGHWEVLNKSLKTKDKNKIWTTLDTDGKMIIEKFRKHMEKEENSFRRIFLPSNPPIDFNVSRD